ncbi:MAG: outer membrane beta-barrel protein [Legionellales bacterium]|nr:outer membrane beta-barrel protein [Legionellales bacterium]
MYKSNKSCYLLGLLFLLSTNAHALPLSSLPFNGLYFGGSIGLQSVAVDQNINSDVGFRVADLFISENPLSTQSKMNHQSVMGAIFAGYGRSFNKLYLGGELMVTDANYDMANRSSTRITQNFLDVLTIQGTETTSSNISMNPVQVGLFFRPGILLTPTSLLYARLGASYAKVNLSSNTEATKTLLVENIVAINTSISSPMQKSVRLAVFQIGTGIEQAISSAWTARLDYLYSYYGNIQATAQEAVLTSNFENTLTVLTANHSMSSRLNNQVIMLGLSYHFASS